MTKKRKRNHYKNKGRYNESRILEGLVKRIKKRFGYTPKESQVRKVWRDYCKMIGEGLAKNETIMIDKKNMLFVMGERIKDGSTADRLMKQGRIIGRSGTVTKVRNIRARHLGIKYKIEYQHLGSPRNDVYFEPHKNLSARVHSALMNTQVNYSIKP
jgi:hypothetical protein